MRQTPRRNEVREPNQIGIKYAKQTLISATDFVWKTLQQTSDADRKNVHEVSLYIDDSGDISYINSSEIHISAYYIQHYVGDIKIEITGDLYHTVTHVWAVWQWHGNGKVPIQLIEGIGDFVRLKAGYAQSDWVKPGEGDSWDQGQGFDITARFLEYCESLRNGFVAELKKKMRSEYSVNYFLELSGKTVDQLWNDYKAKHNAN